MGAHGVWGSGEPFKSDIFDHFNKQKRSVIILAFIYKISNSINNKLYIGKTLDSIETRWKEHCRDCKKESEQKRPLYNAMKKYGIDAFQIEPIEECSFEEVDEREKYWINFYNSYFEGYNATLGGDGKAYADYPKIFQEFQKGYNLKEIQSKLGYTTDTIRVALKENGISKKEIQIRGRETIIHKVGMFNKDTLELIKIFPSIKEAQSFLNKGQGRHIAEACSRKRKSAYGYYWEYIDD